MNLTIDLNLSRTETVNVQFEIESARSIKSLIIDTSFEIMKFHVIKTDTSFLLSLIDMNRLKVYFNNVINSLIQMINTNEILRKKKSFSIIRRFDHEFLLWKNFMQVYVNQSFNSISVIWSKRNCDNYTDVLIIHLSKNFTIY
jgi:hypothetical protein